MLPVTRTYITWTEKVNTSVRYKLTNRAILEACHFITKSLYNPLYPRRLTT